MDKLWINIRHEWTNYGHMRTMNAMNYNAMIMDKLTHAMNGQIMD